ncbi:hypothetical protein C8T65DRAFT_746206 [Cerioporus squamosus]|nr:hypothetical protein C8T65DRAFT_746206 [Cerioporus squamosus]
MPLDILIEVFSLMYPRDLLNLARTTKGFRAFLMSRESEPFWRAARRQIEDLPECPTFLSEPAYANLVFFSHCHGCLKPNVKAVMWEFLVRYCPKCKNDLVADHLSGWTFIDNIERATGSRNFVNVHHSYPTRNSSYEEPHYHWPEIEQFDIKFRRGFQTMAARMSGSRRPSKTSRIGKCVKQRLRDEGWVLDLERMRAGEKHEFANLKGVRTSQKLTDNAWTAIRQHVFEYMGRVRERRLARDRHAHLCTRFEHLNEIIVVLEKKIKRCRDAATDWRPTFVDLAAQSDTFREVLNDPHTGIGQRVLALVDAYPAIVNSWLEARKAELAATVRQSVASIPDGVSVLDLAIALFDCTRCQWRGMRWQQVLAHECARVSWSSSRTDADPDYHRALLTTCCRLKWPCVWTQNPFTFNPVVDRMREAIEACGEDPDRVTFEQMESCEVRLVCKSCGNGQLDFSVFDWKTAAYHGSDADDILELTHVPDFEPLSANNASRARQFEASEKTKSDSTDNF